MFHSAFEIDPINSILNNININTKYLTNENMAGPFPVPNATVPYWRTELHELDSHRSTPAPPKKQDIVIIGAGFAGAALAYYLLKDNPSKPSITILEARETCSGATGRNGKSLI